MTSSEQNLDGNQDSIPGNDKENFDVYQQSKIPNRRDSLAKGILKNLKPQDITGNSQLNHSHPIHLPLRDIHVRDSANTGKKSYRRRVSFAPEVTLHKIDLIQPLPEERPPRRRETIAFVPHTPRVSCNSPESSNVNAHHVEDDAAEIMYDSSDVEMEDDSHVYSSPGNSNQQDRGFKIHQDRDDYTETIDMSISRDSMTGNQDEDTMELTKPLGEIQLSGPLNLLPLPVEQQALSQSTELSQSSQGTQTTDSQPSSQSVFGSIKSLFDDEEEEDEGLSVEMDLTQTFKKPGFEILSNLTGPSNEPQDTDFSNLSTDSGIDETMDITSLAEGATDRITIQNTLLNKQINAQDEITMDQTQIYGNLNSHCANGEENFTGQTESSIKTSNRADYHEVEQSQSLGELHSGADNLTEEITMNEITMDETRIYGNEIPKSISSMPPSSEASITPIRKANNQITPLKAVRSHTSETGSPSSSKRKYQPESDAVANDLRERLNSLTPKKKRKSLLTLQEDVLPATIPETVVEADPVPQLPAFTSQETPRPNFTPLRSSRVSLVNTGRPELGSFTETVPLAPSHEQIEEIEQEYQPVTLQKFLNDLSVEFFDDLNVNDDFTVDLRPITKSENISPVDFIVAKNSKLPWLELYSFSCEELQNNMNELKRLFENLNEEFSEENPQLVRDYYEANGVIQQKKMNDRLLLMKTYADKEAECAWYSWRFKLLDELVTRLDINHSSLSDDFQQLEHSLNEINEMQETLSDKKKVLDVKLQEALVKKHEIESQKTEHLVELRRQLLEEFELYEDEVSQLKELESDIEELELQVVNTTAIEEEIMLKQAFVERNNQEPRERLQSLLEGFDKLQSIAGLQFKSLVGTTLKIALIGVDIDITIDLLNMSDRQVELSNSLPETTRLHLNEFLGKNGDLSLPELIVGLKSLSSALKKLHLDLFYLSSCFSTKVSFRDGLKVEIIDFSRSNKYKIKILLKLDNDMLLKKDPMIDLSAHIIYGSEDLNESTILSNLRKKFHCTGIFDHIGSMTLVRN